MRILDGSEDVVSLQHGIGDEYLTRLEVGYQLGNAAGDGTFQTRTVLPSSNEPFDAVIGDVNDDSNPDIVALSAHMDDYSGNAYAAGSVSIYLGNGNGTFGARMSFRTDWGTQTLALADMNNDGRLDVVASGNTASVLLSNGDGTFQARKSFVFPVPRGPKRKKLFRSGMLANL